MVPHSGYLKQHQTVAFFLLAFVFCWIFWIPRAIMSHGPESPGAILIVLQMIGVFGPCAAAVMLSMRAGGREAVARLFAPYRAWKIGGGWYAFVIAFRPLIWLSALAIYLTLGVNTAETPSIDWPFYVAYLVTQFPLVGIGEELGWMGFAYTPLRRRFSFLSGNLMLGLLWALWHLPMFFTVGDSQYGASFILFAAKLIAIRFMMAVAFEVTGSLLMPALFHVSMNALSELVPLSPNDPLAIAITIILSFGIIIVYVTRRAKVVPKWWQNRPLSAR